MWVSVDCPVRVNGNSCQVDNSSLLHMSVARKRLSILGSMESARRSAAVLGVGLMWSAALRHYLAPADLIHVTCSRGRPYGPVAVITVSSAFDGTALCNCVALQLRL